MAERDRTEDWLLPESARPPTLAELEARIDEAMAIAHASEAAAVAVGAAAIDAAEQARRAAELAERASAAMLEGSRPGGPAAADEIGTSAIVTSDENGTSVVPAAVSDENGAPAAVAADEIGTPAANGFPAAEGSGASHRGIEPDTDPELALAPAATADAEDGLEDFYARADRLAERLERLRERGIG